MQSFGEEDTDQVFGDGGLASGSQMILKLLKYYAAGQVVEINEAYNILAAIGVSLFSQVHRSTLEFRH